MLFRKLFLIIIVFIISGFPVLIARSEVQPGSSSEVTYIGVNDVEGTTEIEIKSSSSFTYTIYRPSDPYKVVVELQDTALGAFNEKIRFDRAGVLEITPLTDESMPDSARLEIALTTPADIEPKYSENSLILVFENPDAGMTEELDASFDEEGMDTSGEADKDEKETVDAVEAAVESVDEAEESLVDMESLFREIEGMSEVYDEEEQTGTGGTTGDYQAPKYTGEKISIDFQDAELVHVFRLLADVSGFNIVVSPDVKGKFSMKLLDVPWDQALDVILRNYQLSQTVEGNIIRVAPTSVLAREEEAIAQARDSQEKSGNLVTKIYPINYANVFELKKAIEDAKILTKRGFVSVDSRTTSVIIKDVDKKHKVYEGLIRVLDIPTPQVSIDARIVEVTTGFTKELGIQWGAHVMPNPQTQISGTGLAGDSGFFSQNPLLVNLPATVGRGSGGAIGVGYIGAGALRALDFQLSAMESSGKGKVISNPRIITMDNQEAVIRQGKKIPYETISDQGTKTEFVDAALELIVTPHITPDGTILMNLEVKKNEADFSQTSGDVPTIDTKEIVTQVLIKTGDTLAIGGIFKTNRTKDLASIPGLGNIPVLGWLFKNEKKVDAVSEILIFITPRMIDRVASSE